MRDFFFKTLNRCSRWARVQMLKKKAKMFPLSAIAMEVKHNVYAFSAFFYFYYHRTYILYRENKGEITAAVVGCKF